MTAEVTSADAQPEDHTAVVPVVEGYDDDTAKLHLTLALGFLVVSTVLGSMAALQLVLPDVFVGAGFFAYSTLLPIATNLFLYGWLTIGLLGAIYYILPRLTGTDLEFGPLSRISGILLAAAYLVGSVAINFGANEGRQYLELPIWADALALVGLLAAIRSITETIRHNSDARLSPVEWYFGSAPIWLVLTVVVGNIPGMIGVNSEVQTAFYRGSLFGLWFAAAGVGVVYFLVPTLLGGSPRRPSRLSAIGFWSLGFVWALTGISGLTYSAIPDWAESMGVLFSIVLFLPVLVIFSDILDAVRGKWDRVVDKAAMRLVISGAVLFALIPVVNLGLALRSSNSVVGFTQWATALEWVAAYGAFSLWVLALIVHAAPTLNRGALSPRALAVHYRATILGLVLAIGAMLASGLQVGLTWIANANALEPAVGEGFRSSVTRLEGWYWIRFIGFVVFAVAQLWFVVAYVMAKSDAPVPEPLEADDTEDADEYEPVGLDRLRRGTVGLFAVAVVFGLVFPMLESSHITNTLYADETRYTETDDILAQGKKLYLTEGCWYCHTQEVRQIVADAGLGAVSQPGDYAWDVPAPRGTGRIGPDLFHVGSRDIAESLDTLVLYLFDPRSVREWSTMPSYQHLSDAELQALAQYLQNLE